MATILMFVLLRIKLALVLSLSHHMQDCCQVVRYGNAVCAVDFSSQRASRTRHQFDLLVLSHDWSYDSAGWSLQMFLIFLYQSSRTFEYALVKLQK